MTGPPQFVLIPGRAQGQGGGKGDASDNDNTVKEKICEISQSTHLKRPHMDPEED